VDESWPVGGIRTSFYSRHKAEVEYMLDRFELEQPHVRVVRLRPGLIFKREAATGIRRLFVGPFLPNKLLRPGLLRVIPDVPGIRVQAVHSLDVGEAYRLAIVGDARGAFNRRRPAARRRTRRAPTRRAKNPNSARARPQPRVVQLPAATAALAARLARPRRTNAASRRDSRAARSRLAAHANR
jgi:hypothetical protein